MVAFNMWQHGNTVHAEATYNRLVPLCVEADARRAQRPLPEPDEESDSSWMDAIPLGHAIGDDHYPVTCQDCIEWRKA